jgi:hypothetical protein
MDLSLNQHLAVMFSRRSPCSYSPSASPVAVLASRPVHRRSPCFLLAPRLACHQPSCFLLACASPARHAPARLRIAGHRACFSPSTSLAIVLPARLRIAGPPCSCSPAHRQPPCLLLAQHVAGCAPARLAHRRSLCSCSTSVSPAAMLASRSARPSASPATMLPALLGRRRPYSCSPSSSPAAVLLG